MSEREVLTLESLAQLGGGVASAVFAQHLKRAASDCYDRPGDPKPRVVQLQVALVPVIESDLTCHSVKTQIQASSKVPHHRSKVYNCRLRPSGQLEFQPDSLDNADQETLFGEDKDSTDRPRKDAK